MSTVADARVEALGRLVATRRRLRLDAGGRRELADLGFTRHQVDSIVDALADIGAVTVDVDADGTVAVRAAQLVG